MMETNKMPAEEQFDNDGRDIMASQGIILAHKKVGKRMRGRANIELLGRSLSEIVKQVESGGAKHGVRFGLSEIMSAAPEILSHIIKASGAQVTDEQQKAAIGLATGMYLEDAIKSGKMTKEQLGQLAQQLSQSGGQAPQQPGGAPNGGFLA
jgi:hypothetical protein